MAVGAASDNTPAHHDIASAIGLAEASGRRSSWAEVTPSSVLLLPYGGYVAAVADLMDVTYDAQVGHVLALELWLWNQVSHLSIAPNFCDPNCLTACPWRAARATGPGWIFWLVI
jgi:hypothetical protein